MSLVHSRPKWGLLYLTFPLMLALLIVERRLKLSASGHQAALIAIILLTYGLLHWWLKANARALSDLERTEPYDVVIVSRIPPRKLPSRRPMFEFPEAEIKGTLSDTFEIDVIDAEFLPLEDPATGLTKE